MDIDPKLAELLHKVRKGATSDMRVGAWEKVLTHLGYRCEIVKDRNTAVEFRVTAHDGTQAIETKEPNYKYITMYKMERWLVGQGVREQAAKALGLEVDQEKRDREKKKLYDRDLTNTGTCGICGGNYKREADGGLHHHGYQRPGHGYLIGACFGTGKTPWELSSKPVRDYIDNALIPGIKHREARALKLEAGRVESIQTRGDYDYRTGSYKPETLTPADGAKFMKACEAAARGLRSEADMMKSAVNDYERAIASWELDELPEIKYAGKFRR